MAASAAPAEGGGASRPGPWATAAAAAAAAAATAAAGSDGGGSGAAAPSSTRRSASRYTRFTVRNTAATVWIDTRSCRIFCQQQARAGTVGLAWDALLMAHHGMLSVLCSAALPSPVGPPTSALLLLPSHASHGAHTQVRSEQRDIQNSALCWP